MKHYSNVNNLGEWAILLYLEQREGSKRRELVKDLNVNGATIGRIIKQLHDKDIIKIVKGSWHGDNTYYLKERLDT